MHSSRSTALLVLVLVLASGAVSCSSGLDPEEAQPYCDDERKTDSTCVNDAAYQQCLSCYEECGVECARLESCPVQFSCP